MIDTLGIQSPRLARTFLRTGSRSRFGPLVTPQSSGHADDVLVASRYEHADGERLMHLVGRDLDALRGKRLLDVGCGYGGRTVFYAEAGAEVVGLEPFDVVVDLARRFAGERGVQAEFVVGRAEALPFEPASFDLTLCFDVLEHVEDPRAAIGEIARVTRVGGEAWLVFPTYLGARSSHLDFVTRTPALHRLFDPGVLASVANDAAEGQGIATRVRPGVGAFGRQTVSDSLNGMNAREAERLLLETPFEWRVTFEPIVEPTSGLPLGPWVSKILSRAGRRLPELLIGRVIAVGARIRS